MDVQTGGEKTSSKNWSDADSLDLFEANIHSFIIKIWLEEPARADQPPKWRGYVTHIPGDERHYLQAVDDIATSILPYLEDIGITPPLSWRIRRWLKQWKLPLTTRPH